MLTVCSHRSHSLLYFHFVFKSEIVVWMSYIDDRYESSSMKFIKTLAAQLIETGT